MSRQARAIPQPFSLRGGRTGFLQGRGCPCRHLSCPGTEPRPRTSTGDTGRSGSCTPGRLCLGSTRKRMVTLRDSGHVPTVDRECKEAAERTSDFIQENAGRTAMSAGGRR